MAWVLPDMVVYSAGAVILGLGAGVYWGVNYYSRMKKFAHDTQVEEICKKKGYPMVRAVDAGGIIDVFVGDKADENDPAFKKHRKLAVHIDPKLFGRSPQNITKNGVQELTYFFNKHMPVDQRGIFAVVALRNKIRKDYDVLNFIQDDTTLVDLVLTNNADLEHDCQQLLTVYENTSLDAHYMAGIVREIQKEIKRDKIPSGYYSISEGLKLLPLAETSSDALRLLQLAETKGARDVLDQKVDKQWTYIYMALALLGGITACMYFLVKYVK